jgi:hypothetical protein
MLHLLWATINYCWIDVAETRCKREFMVGVAILIEILSNLLISHQKIIKTELV